VIYGFTLVVAFFWKDVIEEFIEVIVPPGEELFVKLITAILATILVVVMIYVMLRTERQADKMLKQIKKTQEE
jgi:type VI protein secretion system component VasF